MSWSEIRIVVEALGGLPKSYDPPTRRTLPRSTDISACP
jgi:hypothetical protein